MNVGAKGGARGRLWLPVGFALALPAALAPAQDSASSLPPQNVFEGQVVDAEGKPVPAAKIAVVRADEGFISYSGGDDLFVYAPSQKILFFLPTRNGRGSAELTSDADGRFRTLGLKAGKVHIVAAHKERGVAVITDVAQPNEGKPLRVALSPPTFIEASIKGLGSSSWMQMGALEFSGEAPWMPKITDPSEIGASLMIQPTVMLNSDGSFRAGPLPADGVWRLTLSEYVRECGYSATTLSVPIETKAGGTAKFEFDLTAGTAVEGRVVGPKGEPLGNVSVTAAAGDAATERIIGAVTDSEGRYKIPGLVDGSYQLGAKRWARRTAPG